MIDCGVIFANFIFASNIRYLKLFIGILGLFVDAKVTIFLYSLINE